MKPRLLTALLCFVSLAVLAGVTLDGMFRISVWVFLGGMAAKTWIATLRDRTEEPPAD